MKRTRFLLTTITAAAVAAFSFAACDKPADKPADSQPGQPGAPGKAAEPAKPGEPAKAAAAAAPAIAAADVAKISGTYGFVAKLPKSVEAFSASYRMHDLWLAVANSKWAAALLEIPEVKGSKEYAQMQEGWNSPQAAKAKEVLAEVLGQETTFVAPAGFTTALKPWVDVLGVYYSTSLEAYASLAMSGGKNPQRMQQMMRDAAPRFVPLLAKCDMPPMVFAFKAGKIRPQVEEGVEQLKELIKAFPPLELGTFKIGDTEFTSVTVTVKKLMAQFQAVQLELQLKEALGDEKQAKAVIEAIDAKKLEIAWGWMGDYLILTLGPDHNHVSFVAGAAESALAIPEVGVRAAQFAEKKPISLTYVSKSIQDAFAMNFDFAEAFKTYAEELGGILKPEQISGMVADVKKLETQAKALFTTTYDALVQVDYAEGGLHSEIFGGARNKSIDSSKPLSLSGLATPASFIFLNGRSNAAHGKAVLDFVESAGATVWGWYEKYGRTMVPESERQGFAFAEATVLPLVKDFWKASRTLGNALGDESAFIFDTAGTVPKIADLPPWVAEGKMPRLAWVVTMKDRAGVAEAWKGYESIIKQLIPFIPEGYPVPQAQSKTDGDVELHFVPLPVPTDDLLPHIAISKDRWILSTAPSFSKELAAKPAAAAGQPLGGYAAVNVTALLDHAEAWLKVVDKNAAQIPGSEDFVKARPLIDTAIKLARSFDGVEAKVSDEGGQTRQSIHLKLHDLK